MISPVVIPIGLAVRLHKEQYEVRLPYKEIQGKSTVYVVSSSRGT